MAYCRFAFDKSDVYIYDDVTYGLLCCWCKRTEDIAEDDHRAGFIAGYDYNAMLEHVQMHRSLGDNVPSYVDERLKEDMERSKGNNDQG